MSVDRDDKINVVYIAGSPHSGTTLIDLLVSSPDECFSVGELWSWDYYVDDKVVGTYNDYKTCTCNKYIKECEFWKSVTNNFEENYETNSELLSLEIKKFRSFLIPFRKTSIQVEVNDYEKLLLDVENNLDENNRFIIDSSKSFVYLYYLAITSKINLKVIHIVRDARGQVNSIRKVNKSLGIAKSLLYWMYHNYLIRKICNLFKIERFNIYYDEFVKDPDSCLNAIGNWLSLDYNNYIQKMNAKTHHNVGGNLMRFKKIKRIRRDVKWTRELSISAKIFIGLFSYPFNTYWKKRHLKISE